MFSYNFSETFREQSSILKHTFTDRFKRIQDLVKQHLAQSSKELWKCDVATHKRKTKVLKFGLCLSLTLFFSFLYLVSTAYTEITNFLQGYVDNEANLNSEGSCTATCMDYVETRHYDCVSGSLCDLAENRHESAKCDGIIRNCDVIDNSDLTICEIV